ncbi:MAG: 2-oxo acid dehydrogenase subunit E2 [Spirochaetes bacterium]|nr:2-oxo acid dehydrogenase subunit E2 [Spirochaetota bacterium]
MAEKVLMIALSPTMETGTVVRWRKKEGDQVKSGDVICEVETDKATMDYEASAEGTLLKIVLAEGGQAKVGDLIAVLGSPGEDISGLLGAPAQAPKPSVTGPAAAAKTAIVPPPSAPPIGGRLRSSPLARKLAEDRSIDLRSITGSGPGGRIVKRDVEAPSGDEVVPVSGMRKIIAKRLSESMFSAPHYYLTVSVAADELLGIRAKLNAGREKKVSLNAILFALAGRALARHPRVNSAWNGETIVRRGSADIGLAVALPDGLVTPVVRDCGRKGILAIDSELADLVERARAGKLAPAEYAGAGFTISNLGSFGIDEFTAIINPPGSAILAVGAARKRPVVETGPEGDRIVARTRMAITLSCDHRVIDGAVGAAFLRDLADMIENPALGLA